MTRSLADVLHHADVLLLDFDGPVCSTFAGRPAPGIADELRTLIAARGVAITVDLARATGPFQTLTLVAKLGDPTTIRAVAEALRDAEVDAVRTARPTPGADNVLSAARATGRRIAIVTNNALEAVRAYLDQHSLTGHVDLVVARYDGMHPRLLKPHDHLVRTALQRLEITPDRAVFVGDSTTDIEAGRHAGVPTIGYANKPGKRDRLTTAGAHAVIDHMTELADALTAHPPQHNRLTPSALAGTLHRKPTGNP